ncbi:MAG: hypothetical protein JNG83_13125 [Opitutaceae bacterium]|nr:hypothetical protein [Opitutaceae bacterium]
MPKYSRRLGFFALLVLLLVLLLLLLARCQKPSPTNLRTSNPVSSTPEAKAASAPTDPVPGFEEKQEPATLQFAPSVNAGAMLTVTWTGPNNPKDFVTLVKPASASRDYGNYRDTRAGNPLEIKAPIEPGDWEVRYVAGVSHRVLGRAPLQVVATAATLSAPSEVIAGGTVKITWTGPNNEGDYLTLVPRVLPDGQYGNYTYTSKGSPLEVTAPIVTGDAELRYMTGQGAKVLQRVPIRIVAASVSLSAPATVTARADIPIEWTGPNHAGDYLTLVPRDLPDGQYRAYAYTTKGSPLALPAPKEAGIYEVRYMSGQGAKVLERRPIVVIPER